MQLVKIDTRRISDWDTFHDVFVEVFGFPGFHGRNMNAWLDDTSTEMFKIHAPPGRALVLELEHVDDFIRRCQEQDEEIIMCAAFVNWRKIEAGEGVVLGLSFYKRDQGNTSSEKSLGGWGPGGLGSRSPGGWPRRFPHWFGVAIRSHPGLTERPLSSVWVCRSHPKLNELTQ